MRFEDDQDDNGPFWQACTMAGLRGFRAFISIWYEESGNFDPLHTVALRCCKWQFWPFLLFLNQPCQCCPEYGGDDETWDTRECRRRRRWGKSRITFSVEEKQDGKSTLPLFHWGQDRPRIVLPNCSVEIRGEMQGRAGGKCISDEFFWNISRAILRG